MESATKDIQSSPAKGFPWPLIGQYPYTAFMIVLLGIMGAMLVGKKGSEWDEVYYGSARLLLEGKDFYKDIFVTPAEQIAGLLKTRGDYTYPPFSAAFMLPFAILPLRVGRAIWCVICAATVIYGIRAAWRLGGGARLEPVSGAAPSQHVASMLGHLCAFQLTLNAFSHLQTDLPIFALLMAGCVAMSRGRYFRAATWIGFAAAFKATPLLFAPYLMVRRQWLAGIWVILFAIALNLTPDLVHRPADGRFWLTHWTEQYIVPMAKPNFVPGDWKNTLNNNQSFGGAANRWLGTRWTDEVRPTGTTSTGQTRELFLALCLVAGLPAAWVMLRRISKSVGGVDRAAIECGIVLLMMLLLSPNSSRAHFCIMYLPAFCLARLAVRSDCGKLLRWTLALAIAASLLSIHLRLPGTQSIEQYLLWVGVVTIETVLLLAGCVIALGLRQQPVSD